MQPSNYSGLDMYPNPVQTGEPLHQGPRRKVWPPIVAFLLVATVAVGLVVIGYRYLAAEAERTAAAEAAAAALALSEDECALVLALFDTWREDDPHLTLEMTRQLTAESAAVSVGAGQEFAAGLETVPEHKAQEVRTALRAYNEALAELTAALSTGAASDRQAEAAWSARTELYHQHDRADRACD